MKENRLNKILEEMNKENLHQMIITSPAAVFYLTGKWIESGERLLALYINTKGDKKLVINELFPIHENLGVDLVWYNDTQDPVSALCNIIDKSLPIGIDKNWQAHFLIRLMENSAAAGFVNGSPIIDRARTIKDAEEIELMRKASAINDRVMGKIVSRFSKDKSEKAISGILGELYEEERTQGFSFTPIVAYGANGADPHHETDSSIVKLGDSVIIDTGCRNEFYCSDMTRTFFCGEPSEEARKVYEIVLEANLAGIRKVKPGTRFCDIDKAARDVIEGYGYGKYFTHRTGHSIGIEVHDFGDVSSVNKEEVKPGMIFSIEPGIYIQNNVGVRIEDLVLVTEDGCEVLNSYPKDLIVI
ncbi:M24 family metallopeptidase [Clostridium folliculivorans]|uniref:Proline dipeptidase n=1 Tax=Clostridium folliculivorans TaxID=2886038 RepID=A0A9W6DBC0_9CLOT|nr:Xaa-Pro peptidase family protein [Clostridium folliculivorans]GKU26114.1 proline dipeptidase [Clostridium folliculivorans]GKU28200.1 proline dipeptidase [Clostridium folliculivorans]